MPRTVLLFAAALFCAPALFADVIINEFQAAPNEYLLDWNAQGEPRVGTGPHWQDLDFNDATWASGQAPLGVGVAAPGTNLTAQLQNKSPTLYVRKSFTLTAQQAGSFGDLMLRVSYDDGFVAFINGREAARANMGPAKQFCAYGQTTYRADSAGTAVDYNLGPLANWLVAGANVLAVQMHNRDLTSNSRIDPSLFSVVNPVTGVLANVSFADANGASKTYQNVAGSISTSSTGTPPAGSWLATAPAPQTSAAWQNLIITSTLTNTDGYRVPGAMRYDFSQTGPDQAAAVFGAPVPITPFLAPANLTTADLAKLTVSFNYKISAGTTFGFRADAAAGGPGLTGLPALSDSGTQAEAAPRSFATSSGGARLLRVDLSGVAQEFTQLTPVADAKPFAGPATRGGTFLEAEFRLLENSAAGSGAGGSTGVLQFSVTRLPSVWDYFGCYVGNLEILTLPPGALDAAMLGDVSIHFDWKLDAGESYRVFLQPETGGYADRQDFGTITGTGAYQHFAAALNSGSTTGAFLAAINASGTRRLRLVFRRETAIAVGKSLWIDNVGYTSAWRQYSTALSAADAASQTAFVNQLKSLGLTSFLPAFVKQSTAPAAPSSIFVVVDNFKVDFNGSPDASPQTFVANSQTWKYHPGRVEPSGGLTDPGYFNDPLYSGDFSDWIELHNNGTSAQDLTGWSLTDDPDEPAKWTFPPGTSIPAGGYLVVLADAPPTPPSGAVYLHTNFSLNGSGEFLGLFQPGGVLADSLSPYPAQFPFHTYGRSPGGGPAFVYLRRATPGAANAGPTLTDYVRTPDFSLPGGFYATAQTISLTCETAGAEIRYTTDGSDPGPSSLLYTTPLALSQVSSGNGHCLRARAFKSGMLPSGIKTHTYLINQNSNLLTGPAVIVTGDPTKNLFDPYGIMAIEGGAYTSGPWQSLGPNDYNNALADINNATNTTLGLPIDGMPWERPVSLEFYYPDGRDGFREDVGIRISGSPFTRPRYVLNTVQSAPWSYTSSAEKPGFNVFFRDQYGKDELSFPLFPGDYPVSNFSQFRFRAGHNDIRDPFVKDEFIRRVFINMGQHGSRGLISSFYVNGKFRGAYNITERLREPFMRAHFNSDADWDVRQVTEVVSGDTAAFTDYVNRLEAYFADQANTAKYNAVLDTLDLVNYIDYAIVNTWGGTGDWPHNNYVCSRERSATGKWRWFVWDAEGICGGFSKHLGYNVLTQDLLSSPTTAGREICRTYSRLMVNKEFRQLFADRINKHFCNGGALTDSRLTAAKDQVTAEYQPLFVYTGGGSVNQTWFTSWVHSTNPDKKDVLFRSAPLNQSGSVSSYASANGGASTSVNIGTHVLTPGASITISGSSQATYNGTWTISAVASSTVTIPVAYNATTPTTLGSWSVTGFEFGYQFPDQNVWPALNGRGTWNAPLPPLFNQHGGDVPAGFSLAIYHTEVQNDRAQDNPYKIAASQSPAGRIVYYTTSGADPRLTGGAVNPAALAYSGPVVLTTSLAQVKARIYNTANQEWSPLTEAEFRVGAVSPSRPNLVVAEIMYNPPDPTQAELTAGFTDKDEFEFVRLKNVGAQPVRLFEAHFTVGVQFDCSASTLRVIDPGQNVLIVSNLAAFQLRYGHGFDAIILGEFSGNLSNGGETLRLDDSATPTANAIQHFAYDDDAPWPMAADGAGSSLLLVNPNSSPDHTLPENWTASALPGGLFDLGGTQGYARWRDLVFSPVEAADGATSDMLRDPDRDGLVNLAEFALGTLPMDAASVRQPAADLRQISGQRYLCIEYRTANHAAGVTCKPQISGDLGSWLDGPGNLVLVSSTAHPDGSTTRLYRDTTPFDASRRRFIRLQVQAAP